MSLLKNTKAIFGQYAGHARVFARTNMVSSQFRNAGVIVGIIVIVGIMVIVGVIVIVVVAVIPAV